MAMTVRELIEELQKMDPDRVVILQKDSEGNGYSPCEGADDNAVYIPDSTWSGDVKKEELSDDDLAAGYTEEDLYHGTRGKPAVVLFPVN